MANDATPCNKRGFASHKEAKKALKQCKRNARTNPSRTEQKIYQCPWCSEWHMTSQR